MVRVADFQPLGLCVNCFPHARPQEIEKQQFIAVSGMAGEFGERDPRRGRAGPEMSSDVAVANHLKHRLHGFLEPVDCDDVFAKILLEIACHTFGDMRSQPPFFVTCALGRAREGGGEPASLESHDLAVGKADQGEIIAQSNHALKRSGCAEVRDERFSKL